MIGGTGLISTSITRQLMARGSDDVTLYNRGKSEARAPGNWKQIRGDRTDTARFEAQMQAAGSFDCVMDMIGYLPGDLESAVRAFKGRVGQYIFCRTVDFLDQRGRIANSDDDPLEDRLIAAWQQLGDAMCQTIVE
jgi:hypothetical protein